MTKDKISYHLNKIGGRISFLRKERKLNQSELSSLANINQSHLSRIEDGKYNVRIGTYMSIAIALDVDLSELFRVGAENQKT